MTRYEQGFIQKCAEYGVDANTASELLQKQAGSFTNLVANGLQKGIDSVVLSGLGKPMLSGLRRKATAKWLIRLLSNNAGQLDDAAINYITKSTKVSPDKIMAWAPNLKGIKGLDSHDPGRGALNFLAGDKIKELVSHRTPYYFKR